jgi:ATP-dependent helicase/nuclease subunit B
VVFMMGLNDGAFPTRPADDVLIPDRQRQDVGEAVPLRSARATAQRRDYLAVLGSAATVLSFPRGNQRDGRELRPSRWLLDTLAEVTGSSRRLYAGDLDVVPEGAGYQVVRSFLHAVAADDAPVDLRDRDLRSLLEWTRSNHSVADHFLCHTDPQLGRGIEARRSQRQGFTRFNGNLSQVGGINRPEITSATRLEGFATCPRRYFFESVLRVAPRPEASRLLATEPIEKGTLVHAILEEYVASALGELPTNGSDDPLSLARLMHVADAKMEEFEAQGRCGPPAAWRVDQIVIRRELRTYWAKDRAWRLESGARTVQVEHSFGFPPEGGPPVTVGRPQGEPVLFRGRIDRVDQTSDGSTVVIDYKTGSSRPFAGVDVDHYAGGRHLQLGVYGLAVASGAGPVRSTYDFVSERGGYRRIGHPVGPAEIDTLEDIVDTLATTMEQGWFPAQPGPVSSDGRGQCDYCPYDAVCPPNRHDVWERVRQDPVLVRFVELVDPDPEVDPE